MRKLISVLIASTALLGSCRGHSSTEPLGVHGSKVLFLGNSLTYTNDLPGVFRDLAAAGGIDVGVQSVAYPNMALIDYLDRPEVLAIIDRGWNYVVMQQGGSTLPICRDTLVLSAKLLAPRIRAKGGVPALLASWPSSDRQFAFPAAHESFALAAQAVDGVFLPVGDAWLEAWKINPAHALYGVDGYHPGREGTYLAALVIYEKLTGKDARELPVDMPVGADRFVLPETVVRELQIAAHIANSLPVPKVVVPPTPVAPPITC